jgi:hypothetical protein
MIDSHPSAHVHWSDPVPVERLRDDRSTVPRAPGLYVFTNHAGAVEQGPGVLYVGKTEDRNGLWSRLSGYLKDPGAIPVLSGRHPGQLSSRMRHAGKLGLLTEIQQKYRNGNTDSHVFVRWSVNPAPSDLEKALIQDLKPKFNTQHNGEPTAPALPPARRRS